MMVIIFITILSITIPGAAHPLSSSSFTFTLCSDNHSKTISPWLDCSCQIAVFVIANDQYNLTVQSKHQKKGFVRVKVSSSGQCLKGKLGESRSASFIVTSQKYQDTEFTQQYLVSFSEQQPGGCQGMEGEERRVYLVNRTREQLDGCSKYVIRLPKNAIRLTQLLGYILLMVLSFNIKYRRFTPCPFNMFFAIGYSVILFAIIYIEIYLDDKLQITFWIVMLFAIASMMLYFIDITSIWIRTTSVIIAISASLCLLIAFMDLLIFPDAWPLNDVIGILVAGALIKFIVIKKLKSAIIPLLFLWLFFLFRQFMVFLNLQSFEQALHIKVVPLFLQIPAILGDSETGFICSAFGTSKIVTMGLVVNYCVRIDLFLSTKFYTILSCLIAFIAMLIEYLILQFADELPFLEFTSIIIYLPVALATILLLAAKRGEWAQLWHGSFHDIAVDRKSIKKESLLEEEDLDKHLDSLKMDASWLASK